jgi:serine/threonine protein kinase
MGGGRIWDAPLVSCPSIMIGRIIGNYEVISQFGEGGMGELYLGRHIRLAREVIIKTIRTEDFNPRQIEHLRERLEREAFVQSQLDHTNIVRVYDFIATNDATCMVMEFVPGRDLRKVIISEIGPLAPARAIHIFRQVLSAVDYAHSFYYTDVSGHKHQGIIHRDLKPANILITPDDVAKVTDFGIVKIRGVKGGTQLGFNPGTPEYMSPEQALGSEIDHRADIYSLGIVFYEMLTGRVPFEDNGNETSDYAVRKGHIELPVPPPSNFFPSIPAELEEIVLKALAKSPDDRFQTAGEFLDAIEELEDASVVSNSRATGAPRQTLYHRDQTSRQPAAVSTRGGNTKSTAQSLPLSIYSRTSSGLAALQNDETRFTPVPEVKPNRVPIYLGVGVALVLAVAAIVWWQINKSQPPQDPAAVTPLGMVRIGGGSFMMGRETGVPEADEIEGPVHKVEVKPFFIDETEVTNEEYQQFVEVTRHAPPPHWKNGHYQVSEALLPVVQVSWHDAKNYCESLGRRLPSEKEWEFAARGKDEKRVYPYGDVWKPRYSNAADNYDLERGEKPVAKPVRSYPDGRSEFGVFDLAGNVLEWTSSEFRAYPGSKMSAAKQLEGKGQYVLKGGAFSATAERQRATDRYVYPPTDKNDYIGFRCAKDAH